MRTLIASLLLLAAQVSPAQKTIYAYAIGNWRNGPTVQMTEVFETTEQFTTEQIMARVKAEYTAFKDITDTDLLLFTDRPTASDNQNVLINKYVQRKLAVKVTSADGKVLDQWPPDGRSVPEVKTPEAPAPIPATKP